MSKILIVSIAAPPKSDPESLQVGRYIKYLTKIGCKVELITTSDPTLYMEPDDGLESYRKVVSKAFVHVLFEHRLLNAFLNRFFPSLTQFPDTKWSFRFYNPKISERPDILYSRSYPISSTLLALKLKKKLGVPWILHLSDPWAISYEGDSPATNFKKLPRKWNKEKELECFSLADRISFTSEKTIQLYKKAYPQFSNKFFITPNVFDRDFKNNLPVRFSSKLTITYTGGFGAKRSPLFFLQGIKTFLDENPETNENIKFIFTGPLTRQNKTVFSKFKSINQIVHLGIVPYKTMLDLQQEAHVLVNIDTDIPSPEHSVFFPSKLLEYFAANRRVLNIGNHHSVSSNIVSQSNGDCIEFGENTQLQHLLLTYWNKFNNRDSTFFELPAPAKTYEAEYNAIQLCREFDTILKLNQTTGSP